MINNFRVTSNGRSVDIIIPSTGDKQYDKELAQSSVEKTKKELDSRPQPVQSKISSKEKSERLKEYNEFRNRKKSDHPKKYF